MTTRKADIPLAARLTAYVSREQGAAELQVSPSTWDDMVECGQIPKPIRLGSTGATLRWRWADVDSALRRDDAGALSQEPFFRDQTNGATKDRQRYAA
jgi:predicted DNA-binding transcriptional regulator AlpA